MALDRDRLGDGAVELTSTSRADHLQGNRPKLVVTEIVREPLISDDPVTPEFVDMINELDVFLEGRPTWFTAVKVVLNFCVPFVVSNAGLVLGSAPARA